jgi:hypothetical protein
MTSEEVAAVDEDTEADVAVAVEAAEVVAVVVRAIPTTTEIGRACMDHPTCAWYPNIETYICVF